MNKHSIALLTTAAAWLVSAPLAEADLFVSGDSNIADPLLGIYNGVPGVDTGNQQFFVNALGPGSSVAVLQSSIVYGGGSASLCVTDVNQFYNSLPGKTSTIISGTISSLAGYNLLVAPLPDHSFTPSEINILRNFLLGGNSVFFLGENSDSAFTAANANINSDLIALGSSLQIIPDVVDPGWHTATGSQIAADPYTAGVSHCTYAAGSSVSGGNYLLFGTAGQPFLTYTSIPEPSSLLLLGLYSLGAIGLRRKLRK